MINKLMKICIGDNYHVAHLEVTKDGEEITLEIMETDGEKLMKNTVDYDPEGLEFIDRFVKEYISPDWCEPVFQWLLIDFDIEII